MDTDGARPERGSVSRSTLETKWTSNLQNTRYSLEPLRVADPRSESVFIRVHPWLTLLPSSSQAIGYDRQQNDRALNGFFPIRFNA